MLGVMQHPLDIPLVRLRSERRLAFRTRVLIAVAILLAVVAGAVSWKHSSVLPVSSEWVTKRLPELGIQFSYPAGWHLQNFDENLGRISMTGALVANVDHDFEHPVEGTNAWDMSGLDDGLIVLSFQQIHRFNSAAKETSGLPLTLDRAEETFDSNAYGAPRPRHFISFAVKGYLHSGVHIYIGDVTAEERDAIDRILASVEPLAP